MKHDYKTKEQLLLNELAESHRQVANLEASVVEHQQREMGTQQELEALQDQVRFFQAILDCVGDGVVVCDQEGKFLLFNPSAERMFGMGAQEVTADHSSEACGVFLPDTVTPFPLDEIPMVKAMRGEEVQQVRMFLQNRYIPEGVHVSVTATPLRDEKGVLKGGVVVTRDVTERVRAAELQQRETSRLVSIGQLAAGMAHEINNPLAVIFGLSELLLEQDLAPKVRSYLEKMHFETQRMAKIVHNLLSFARENDAKRIPVHVRDIIEQAIEMKASEFRVNNIIVTTQSPTVLSPILGDPHLLLEVLLNIFTNAQQAMTETHGGGELIIQTGRTEDRIRISISDSGPGIPLEHLNRIFDPFFTTKEVGTGTGLGLSICHGIIRQHDGNLWAESDLGKGTTFHLELPVLRSDGEEWPQAPQPDDPPVGNKQILVVDDEPGIQFLFSEAWSREGASVDVAKSGQEAWQMLQSKAYDCIIIDLKMPGMNGQALYQLIKDSEGELAPKCIFLTGATFSPETQEFMDTIDNPLLGKPVSLKELWTLVAKV